MEFGASGPREILAGLKERDPESAVISKDIYNLKR